MKPSCGPDTKKARKVVLVCDNLNTHTKGAFYDAFNPATARALAKKIEFHYTPKHGSWLNVAECELSALTRQCLGYRRFGTIHELGQETNAWSKATNAKHRAVNWLFRAADARNKLKSLYPKLDA
ncbi:MAG: transposase [Gemmataceae bacterium]